MPNWVENELEVKGEPSELARFRKFAAGIADSEKKSELTFLNIVPRPEDIDDCYHWDIANWGTKWDAEDVRVQAEGDKILHYDFLTAWSPPTPVVAMASLAFPKLAFTLQYFEGGMGFSGTSKYKAGKLIKEKYNGNYKGRRGG